MTRQWTDEKSRLQKRIKKQKRTDDEKEKKRRGDAEVGGTSSGRKYTSKGVENYR